MENFKEYKQFMRDGGSKASEYKLKSMRQEVNSSKNNLGDKPTSKWRQAGDVLEYASDKFPSVIGSAGLGIASAGAGLAEFGAGVTENIMGATTSKVGFDEPEAIAKKGKEIAGKAKDWTEEGGEEMLEEQTGIERGLLEEGAEFGGELFATIKTLGAVKPAASKASSKAIAKIGSKSPTLAKYLSAKMPGTSSSFAEFVGSVGLEGSIEAAIQKGEVSPSDYGLEAVAQVVFGGGGKAMGRLGDKIKPHMDEAVIKSLKDTYSSQIKQVTEQGDKFPYASKLGVEDTPFIHRLFPDSNPSSALEVLDDVVNTVKSDSAFKLSDLQDQGTLFKYIDSNQRKIGEQIGDIYSDIAKKGEVGDNFISNTKIKAGQIVSDWLDTQDVKDYGIGEFRPGTTHYKELKKRVKTMFDYDASNLPGNQTFDDVFEKIFSKENAKTVADIKENALQLNKETDLAGLFYHKKKLFPKVKGFLGGGSEGVDSKQALASFYDTLRDDSYKLVDKAVKNANGDTAAISIIKDLSRKYSKYKDVSNSVDMQIKKAMENSGENFSMSNRISLIYSSQKLVELIGSPQMSAGKAVGSMLPMGINHYAEWFNSVDRAARVVTDKMLGQGTKTRNLLEKGGEALRMATSDEAKTATAVGAMKMRNQEDTD